MSIKENLETARKNISYAVIHNTVAYGSKWIYIIDN